MKEPLSMKVLDGLENAERQTRMMAAVADLEARRGKQTHPMTDYERGK